MSIAPLDSRVNGQHREFSLLDDDQATAARICMRLCRGKSVDFAALDALPTSPIDFCGLANTLHHTADVERRPQELKRWVDGQVHLDEAATGLMRQAFRQAEDGAEAAVQEAEEAVKFTTGHRTTDVGNAERLAELCGRDFRHVHAWKKFIVFDGTRWVIDSSGAIVQLAIKAVRSIYEEAAAAETGDERSALGRHASASESGSRITAIVKLVASMPGIPAGHEELDSDPWLLNCENGTIDLRSGVLRPHRREDLLTKICPVRFDPEAECPIWDETLGSIFARDEGMVEFWRRLCGYILTGVTSEQILPILYGVGANGKSTILGTLMHMLGGDYAMKAPADLLMARRETHSTALTDLFGKRLVVAIETNEEDRINESMIKELTGTDRIRARRMREDNWEFFPTHKVFLCTNHKPEIRGTDHAIWRRPRLIPFTVTFDGDQQDKALPDKLAGELPGILAWCVRGCLDWQKSGIQTPEAVLQATEEYRSEQDVLAAFLAEHCVINPKASEIRVRGNALYAKYKEWAELAGEVAKSQRHFGMAMTNKGYKRITNNGTWYTGIGLRHESYD